MFSFAVRKLLHLTRSHLFIFIFITLRVYVLIVAFCCCSVAKLCLTHCNPVDCRTPGSSEPGICSVWCPLSRWCHPTILWSATCFPFCLQSFPASQFFASGDQSIGISALASVLPMNIQGWSPLWLTGLISLQSKRPSSLLQYHNLKASILQHSAFFMVQFSQLYMTTGKTIALTIWTFVGKVMSHFFFLICFLVLS